MNRGAAVVLLLYGLVALLQWGPVPEVKLTGPAQRIASQAWTLDEYAYRVAPEKVVGVSPPSFEPAWSNILELVKKHQPGMVTDPEGLVRLRPDIVLVSSSGREDYVALVREIGIAVARFPVERATFEEVALQAEAVGVATGWPVEGRTEAARVRAALAGFRRTGGPRVVGKSGRMVLGAGTLFDDAVKVLGGRNLAAENGVVGIQMVSEEQIVRWAPDDVVTGQRELLTQSPYALEMLAMLAQRWAK